MKLVIVESPTKAKTIRAFLGDEYQVESSFGHVRDLPKSKLGIDIEHNFEPQYVIPRKAQPTVTHLRKLLKNASHLILATDEDREGEAIAWHLTHALKPKTEALPEIERIVFHEITKSAIERALSSPRKININLVNAQQGRRVLDRLVGYTISPFLWKKVAKGLSAGRVQSVALRLIADREKEIRAFIPQEYWTIAARLKLEASPYFIEATLIKINEKKVAQFDIPDRASAEAIKEELEGLPFAIAHIERKTVKKNPSPPFITSTLQQEGAKRLGFSAKRTMRAAQGLYENGAITYMRTDSTNTSQEALTIVRSWISNTFGAAYGLSKARAFKAKSRLAQEAHEAIRPTNVRMTPEKFSGASVDGARLYELIWSRFVASQMAEAKFDATTIDVHAGAYTLRATGTIMKFDGFLAVWKSAFTECELPDCSVGDALQQERVSADQHFTEPPPRFNEASIIKALEEHGIGRPSTYAPIISVIQERNYVQKEQGRFHPTEIGEMVNTILVENFPKIVDIQFTAQMEELLDNVAHGSQEWHAIIKEFYEPFAAEVKKKYDTVQKQVPEEPTDIVCEKCGKEMVIKFGRFGKFLACSGFPECKNTKTLSDGKTPAPEPEKKIGMKCPKCTVGDIIEKKVHRRGRARGKIFWGCSRYPDCDHATWKDPREPEPESNKKKSGSKAK